jgi:hypothetical protein
MLKVAGVWELGWSAPVSEHPLWEFVLRSYGVQEWYMAPVSGIQKRVTEVRDILEAVELNLDLTAIYVDENGEYPLDTFAHPEDAIYVLGRTSYSPWVASGREGVSLRIETKVPGGMLWPHQCIAMVLHDRMMKS